MKSRKMLVGLALLVAVVGLAGCMRVDMTVKLEPDENWTGTTDIYLNLEALQSVAQMTGEEMDLTEFEAEMEGAVAETLAEYGSRGVTASWTTLPETDTGEVGYRLEMSGQGLDLLNEVMFDGEGIMTFEQMENRQVVSFTVPGFGDEFSDVDEANQMAAMMGMTNIEMRFTLEAREILTANGEIVDGSKVVWLNQPGPYQAVVVTQASPLVGGLDLPEWAPWVIGGVCCLLLVVVIVVVVVAIVLSSKKKKAAGV